MATKKRNVGRPKLYKETLVIPLRIEKSILVKAKKKCKTDKISFNKYMNNLIEKDII